MPTIPRRFISVALICHLEDGVPKAFLVGRSAWYLVWEAPLVEGKPLPRPVDNLLAAFSPSMVTVDKKSGVITINVDCAPDTSLTPHAEVAFQFADAIILAAAAFYLHEKPVYGWRLAIAGCPGEQFKQHRKEGM